MKIESQLHLRGDNAMAGETDHVFLAVHQDYLLKDAKTVIVEKIDAIRFKSDLISYMIKLRIPENMHYIVMRMSGMNTYLDFGPGVEFLYIPDETRYAKLISIYRQRGS